MAPSCKLELGRFSALLRIQEGVECGNFLGDKSLTLELSPRQGQLWQRHTTILGGGTHRTEKIRSSRRQEGGTIIGGKTAPKNRGTIWGGHRTSKFYHIFPLGWGHHTKYQTLPSVAKCRLVQGVPLSKASTKLRSIALINLR